jgi:hypothetical protein
VKPLQKITRNDNLKYNVECKKQRWGLWLKASPDKIVNETSSQTISQIWWYVVIIPGFLGGIGR